MICRDFVIRDSLGFHAVPVSLLAQLAKTSQHQILANDPVVGYFAATSHLRLLALGLRLGSTLKICIDTDEIAVAEAIFDRIVQILDPTDAL